MSSIYSGQIWFKDILNYEKIRMPVVLEKLLIVLASQIGSEVSYNELSHTIGMDKDSVGKYINILEKAFIIFRLPPYARNIRTEISKMRKIYFYDTGIRNTLISNFNNFDSRNDKGELWENFMIGEKLKMNKALDVDAQTYFWQTSQQQEIDYLEEKEGRLKIYEFSIKENSSNSQKLFLMYINQLIHCLKAKIIMAAF